MKAKPHCFLAFSIGLFLNSIVALEKLRHFGDLLVSILVTLADLKVLDTLFKYQTITSYSMGSLGYSTFLR